MRWLYFTVTVIPTLLGMIVTLMILTILVGPPTIRFGGGESTLVIYNAYFTKDPSGKNNVIVMDLHNPGGSKILVIGIKINNKDLPDGPSFSNPLIVDGGSTMTISYIVPKNLLSRNTNYNITVLFAPETGEAIYSTSVLIPSPGAASAKK